MIIDFTVKEGYDDEWSGVKALYYSDSLYYDSDKEAYHKVAELLKKYGSDLKSLSITKTTKII